MNKNVSTSGSWLFPYPFFTAFFLPGKEGQSVSRLTSVWVFMLLSGGLALSRALGDFAYKTSPTLPPQEQIVTGMRVCVCVSVYLSVCLCPTKEKCQ